MSRSESSTDDSNSVLMDAETSLIAESGDIRETRGEIRVEWRVPKISVSDDFDRCFQSPVFSVSDSCWSIRFYSNDLKNSKSEGVYLRREDLGRSRTVRAMLGIKMVSGDVEWLSPPKISECKRQISFPFYLWLLPHYTSSSGVLTFTCSIVCEDVLPTRVSLFSRLWNLSHNLQTVLKEGKGTDFALKLKEGREVRAHRTILEGRCGYFAGMLGNDFQESSTGVGDIDDIEEDVFQCVLSYLYTGEVEGMSDGNVSKIYVAADKLLLEELKKLCADYMALNLSPDLLCDTIAVAERYEDEELRKHVSDYFNQHSAEVFDSSGWKKFQEENSAVAMKCLRSVILKIAKH